MKKVDRGSALVVRGAWLLLAGCAALAPLGCSDDGGGCADGSSSCIGGTGGTGGTTGTGGTAGTGGSGGGDTDAAGAACGGFASLRCPDAEAMFCDFDDLTAVCGHGDMTGICRPRPTNCTADCPGVCGCDSKFYCNACSANRAGADVHPGATCSDAGH
jgi:hypothetical protein